MEQYESIIQKTWEDEGFKQRFMNNPKSVLSEMGHEVGDNMTFEVHDNSLDTLHFVLLDKTQAVGLNLDADPIIGKITKRALEDDDYKTRLLNDSKAAIREVLGIEPQGNIVIHANQPNHVHLVLPANPNSSGDLSDADLAVVAGGKNGENRNWLLCNSMKAVFQGLDASFGIGAYGADGFLGALNKVLSPLITGGVAFSDAASGMDYQA